MEQQFKLINENEIIDYNKNQTFLKIPKQINEIFKSAGVLLYSINDNKIKLFMGCEDRSRKEKKNKKNKHSSITNHVFIPFGGKIENKENAIETALRELNEESGLIFNDDLPKFKQLFESDNTIKFWFPNSKYVLFLAPIDFDDSLPSKYQLTLMNSNQLKHCDQLFLEWVDQIELFKCNYLDPFFNRSNGEKGECNKLFITMMAIMRPFFNSINNNNDMIYKNCTNKNNNRIKIKIF